MRQRSFGVSRSGVSMTLFTLVYCLFEMFDPFFGVRVSLFLLTDLRVRQCYLGMSGKDNGMSHLAMFQ